MDKTLVFCNTKRTSKLSLVLFASLYCLAEEITTYLRKYSYKAVCLNSDKEQSERNYVMDQIRSGGAKVLIAD